MSNHQGNKWVWGLVGALITAIVIVAGYIVIRGLSTPEEAIVAEFVADDDFAGDSPIEPPRDMPDFTLIDQHNEPVALSELTGQPTLISYGFTNCPDVCPLTLGEFRMIHDELGNLGDSVNFVFISVDGKRDTPQRLASYFTLRSVEDFVIGLTGDPEDVSRVAVDYGVKFEYETPDNSGAYSVDHTAGYFLLNAQNQWVMRYAFGTDPDIIIEDLRAMLTGAEA